MSKIYGNKEAKSLHYLKFSITLRRRNSMRNVLTCLTDLQSYISLNEDTATRVDFTKIASVDSPSSQGKPTTAWCRRCTMHRKSNRYSVANTRKHSTPPITPSAGFTETQSQWNYFENWRSHKRLSDKSMPSRPRFSPEINWKSRLARGMLQSLSRIGKTIRHHLRIHDTTRKPFSVRILDFLI